MSTVSDNPHDHPARLGRRTGAGRFISDLGDSLRSSLTLPRWAPSRSAWIPAAGPITGAEYGLIAVLTLIYLLALPPSSPLYGPKEAFEQDTAHIINCLAEGKPYPYNPQHHLLYHYLVERGYSVVTRFVPSGWESAYWYLKVLTVLTGVAFFLTLSRLLRELGLTSARRLLLLLLAGVSVSGWANFTACETHSLAMAAYAEYLTRLIRLSRRDEAARSDLVVLGATLLFMILCRIEHWRLVPLTLVLLLASEFRRVRVQVFAVLALVILLGVSGYFAISKAYFGVPAARVPSVVLDRTDRTNLEGKLMTARNLAWDPVKRMMRATSGYTLVMPTRGDRFREYLSDMLDDPLAVFTFVLVGVMLSSTLALGLVSLLSRDPVATLVLPVLVMHWIASFYVYTWFNPHEPFLWLLEFLPLIIVLIGLAYRTSGRLAWSFLGLAIIQVAIHNTVYFYLPYR
jgi:hypothetical protein